MITWRDEMSVGIAAIDEDHKTLIAIINEFDSCRTRQSSEQVCRKLYAYSKSHFRREESIQAALHYADRARHAEEHALILKRLTILIKTAFIATDRINDRRLVINLGELLHDWVLGHILQSDRALRSFYLAARHKDIPGLPAMAVPAGAASRLIPYPGDRNRSSGSPSTVGERCAPLPSAP